MSKLKEVKGIGFIDQGSKEKKWKSEGKDKFTDTSKGKLTYAASEYPQLYIFGEQTIERHDPDDMFGKRGAE